MKKFMLFSAVALLLFSYQEIWAGETPIECRAFMEGQVALLGGGPADDIEWKILVWPDSADTTKVFSHRLRRDCKIRGIYPDYERSETRFKVNITCDHETGMAKEVWVRPIVPAVKKVTVQSKPTTTTTQKPEILIQAGDLSVVPNDAIRIHVNMKGVLHISDPPPVGQFSFSVSPDRRNYEWGIVGEKTEMHIKGVSNFRELNKKTVSLEGWYILMGGDNSSPQKLFFSLKGAVLF